MALVCPTTWDREQLARSSELVAEDWQFWLYGPDAETDPASFDVIGFIDAASEELSRAQVAGVTSSSDYPGCLVAAYLAEHLGLRGPNLQSLLRSSHKYYSRLAQRRSAPDATPDFVLLDPRRLRRSDIHLSYPLFVKPVKSWFSQFSRQIESFDELQWFLTSPGLERHLREFVRPFNTLLSLYDSFEYDASFMIAEQVISGQQVTLEGYVADGSIEVLGIVDTVMYAGSASFERFVLPSLTGADAKAFMTSITERVIEGLGIRDSLFNIEYVIDAATGQPYVIEVNPRMCGQFADLMECVTGVNTYQVLGQVSLGRTPAARRTGRHGAAVSLALRTFGDGTVVRLPASHDLQRARTLHAVTLVICYYRAGYRLSSNSKQFDGWSYLYAVVNLAGPNLSSLEGEIQAVMSILRFNVHRDGEHDE